MKDEYLTAVFHLGVLAGSVRRPITDEAKESLEYFEALVQRLLGEIEKEVGR